MGPYPPLMECSVALRRFHFMSYDEILLNVDGVSSDAEETAKSDAARGSRGKKRKIDNSGTNESRKQMKFTCSTCGIIFHSNDQVGRHIKLHTVAFECQYCDAKFLLYRQLVKHKETHAGESYECKFCNRLFRLDAQFKEHMQLHYVGRLYRCIECQVAFDEADALTSHYMEIHSGTPGNLGESTHEYSKFIKMENPENGKEDLVNLISSDEDDGTSEVYGKAPSNRALPGTPTVKLRRFNQDPHHYSVSYNSGNADKLALDSVGKVNNPTLSRVDLLHAPAEKSGSLVSVAISCRINKNYDLKHNNKNTLSIKQENVGLDNINSKELPHLGQIIQNDEVSSDLVDAVYKSPPPLPTLRNMSLINQVMQHCQENKNSANASGAYERVPAPPQLRKIPQVNHKKANYQLVEECFQQPMPRSMVHQNFNIKTENHVHEKHHSEPQITPQQNSHLQSNQENDNFDYEIRQQHQLTNRKPNRSYGNEDDASYVYERPQHLMLQARLRQNQMMQNFQAIMNLEDVDPAFIMSHQNDIDHFANTNAQYESQPAQRMPQQRYTIQSSRASLPGEKDAYGMHKDATRPRIQRDQIVRCKQEHDNLGVANVNEKPQHIPKPVTMPQHRHIQITGASENLSEEIDVHGMPNNLAAPRIQRNKNVICKEEHRDLDVNNVYHEMPQPIHKPQRKSDWNQKLQNNAPSRDLNDSNHFHERSQCIPKPKAKPQQNKKTPNYKLNEDLVGADYEHQPNIQTINPQRNNCMQNHQENSYPENEIDGSSYFVPSNNIYKRSQPVEKWKWMPRKNRTIQNYDPNDDLEDSNDAHEIPQQDHQRQRMPQQHKRQRENTNLEDGRISQRNLTMHGYQGNANDVLIDGYDNPQHSQSVPQRKHEMQSHRASINLSSASIVHERPQHSPNPERMPRQNNCKQQNDFNSKNSINVNDLPQQPISRRLPPGSHRLQVPQKDNNSTHDIEAYEKPRYPISTTMTQRDRRIQNEDIEDDLNNTLQHSLSRRVPQRGRRKQKFEINDDIEDVNVVNETLQQSLSRKVPQRYRKKQKFEENDDIEHLNNVCENPQQPLSRKVARQKLKKQFEVNDDIEDVNDVNETPQQPLSRKVPQRHRKKQKFEENDDFEDVNDVYEIPQRNYYKKNQQDGQDSEGAINVNKNCTYSTSQRNREDADIVEDILQCFISQRMAQWNYYKKNRQADPSVENVIDADNTRQDSISQRVRQQNGTKRNLRVNEAIESANDVNDIPQHPVPRTIAQRNNCKQIQKDDDVNVYDISQCPLPQKMAPRNICKQSQQGGQNLENKTFINITPQPGISRTVPRQNRNKQNLKENEDIEKANIVHDVPQPSVSQRTVQRKNSNISLEEGKNLGNASSVNNIRQRAFSRREPERNNITQNHQANVDISDANVIYDVPQYPASQRGPQRGICKKVQEEDTNLEDSNNTNDTPHQLILRREPRPNHNMQVEQENVNLSDADDVCEIQMPDTVYEKPHPQQNRLPDENQDSEKLVYVNESYDRTQQQPLLQINTMPQQQNDFPNANEDNDTPQHDPLSTPPRNNQDNDYLLDASVDISQGNDDIVNDVDDCDGPKHDPAIFVANSLHENSDIIDTNAGSDDELYEVPRHDPTLIIVDHLAADDNQNNNISDADDDEIICETPPIRNASKKSPTKTYRSINLLQASLQLKKVSNCNSQSGPATAQSKNLGPKSKQKIRQISCKTAQVTVISKSNSDLLPCSSSSSATKLGNLSAKSNQNTNSQQDKLTLAKVVRDFSSQCDLDLELTQSIDTLSKEADFNSQKFLESMRTLAKMVTITKSSRPSPQRNQKIPERCQTLTTYAANQKTQDKSGTSSEVGTFVGKHKSNAPSKPCDLKKNDSNSNQQTPKSCSSDDDLEIICETPIVRTNTSGNKNTQISQKRPVRSSGRNSKNTSQSGGTVAKVVDNANIRTQSNMNSSKTVNLSPQNNKKTDQSNSNVAKVCNMTNQSYVEAVNPQTNKKIPQRAVAKVGTVTSQNNKKTPQTYQLNVEYSKTTLQNNKKTPQTYQLNVEYSKTTLQNNKKILQVDQSDKKTPQSSCYATLSKICNNSGTQSNTPPQPRATRPKVTVVGEKTTFVTSDEDEIICETPISTCRTNNKPSNQPQSSQSKARTINIQNNTKLLQSSGTLAKVDRFNTARNQKTPPTTAKTDNFINRTSSKFAGTSKSNTPTKQKMLPTSGTGSYQPQNNKRSPGRPGNFYVQKNHTSQSGIILAKAINPSPESSNSGASNTDQEIIWEIKSSNSSVNRVDPLNTGSNQKAPEKLAAGSLISNRGQKTLDSSDILLKAGDVNVQRDGAGADLMCLGEDSDDIVCQVTLNDGSSVKVFASNRQQFPKVGNSSSSK